MRTLLLSAMALVGLSALSTGCVTPPESEQTPLELTPFAKSFSTGIISSSVASGPEGDILFGGRFGQIVDFGGGHLQPEPQGSVFVAHLDADGNHLFSGATGANDSLQSVAVGPQGDMYAAGTFQGFINFGSGRMSGKNDGYLAAFKKGGASDYSRNLPGKSQVIVDAVAAAPSGDVIIAARADDSADFGDGAPSNPQGTRQLVIASYDHSGKLGWALRVPGYATLGVAMSVDHDGNIVFASAVYQDITLGSDTVSYGAFVGKISATGQPRWLIGSTPADGNIPNIQHLATDAAGDVFVGGVAYSSFSLGGVSATVGFGQQHGFLVKLDADGDGKYASVFPSNSGAQGTGLAVTGTGDVLFGATVYGGIDFGGGLVGGGQGNDVVLARFSGDGTLRSAQALDGSGNEYLDDLTADPTGKPVIVGRFDSTLDIAGTRLVADGNDTFVARIDQ